MIIALILLSAFLHALWNALLRLERDKDRTLALAVAGATVFAALVATVRSANGAVLFPSWRGAGFTLVAGVLEASYFVTLARAMHLGKLGLVYTISRGGAVLVVWPLSMALFGEVATLHALMGSVLVVVGLATSGLGTRGGADGSPRAAVSWAAACAVSIAGYHLAYAAALREGVNPSACFALSLATSTTINMIRLGARGRDELRAVLYARWPRLLVMALVCGGSFLILIEALALGDPGYVLTLRNTSVLFAIAMAAVIGERPRRTDVAGAVLVAAGAALLTS